MLVGVSALDHTCPTCGAKPLVECSGPRFRYVGRRFHKSRVQANLVALRLARDRVILARQR